MILRAETHADHAVIHALHASSFPTDAEARLVDMLRAGGWLVGSYVAEIDGVVCAHVAFSRLIVQREGEHKRATGLAPVSTAAHFRRRGIADALIRFAHADLVAKGEAMSFVLGDPRYYGRFGYDLNLAANYRCVYAGEYFQAMALIGQPHDSGEVIYPPPFSAV